MPNFLIDPYKQFSTLSFRDLLDARTLITQLMRKQNVRAPLWAAT